MSVTPQTAGAISSTVVQVFKVLTAMRTHMPVSALVDAAGLDHSHVPALFSLGQAPQRVSALAESTHADVSTVSRQVTHLVHIGLVEKIDDPDDGRAQLLSLTPSGRRVIDELVTRRGEWFMQLLEGWTEEDAAAFLTHLERFGEACVAFKAGPTPTHHPRTAHPRTPTRVHAAAAGPSHTTHEQEH